MRKELANGVGERKKYRAYFERIGKKTNYKGYTEETILLKKVTDVEAGKIVADHLWFSYTQGFINAHIHPGDSIEFEARSKPYSKGYVNRALKVSNQAKDYKLSNPTQIKKLKVI